MRRRGPAGLTVTLACPDDACEAEIEILVGPDDFEVLAGCAHAADLLDDRVFQDEVLQAAEDLDGDLYDDEMDRRVDALRDK